MCMEVSFAGVDGINGDTMNGVGEEWWLEGQSRGLEVALEPEVFFGDYSYVQVTNNIQPLPFQWDVMSWGYWDYDEYDYTAPPLVSAYKAITRSRHLTHICER